MSTLAPDTESIIVSPELRRRIVEIMEEKGKAFSQQAIAIRIGMHYDTLRKKLRGDSKINMFELRRIAEALHLTIERVMQEDTRDYEKQLRYIFNKIDNPQIDSASTPNLYELLDIAEKLASIAIGVTERTKTLTDLGRAYFLLQRYEDAHKTWLTALEYSKKLMEKRGEKDSYHLLLSNLLLSSTVKEDYSNIIELLIEIETAFCADPVRLGIISYTRAKIAERANNIIEAKEQAYKSLEYALMTNSDRRIGKAEATVAHYEFLDKNYVSAREHLESSIAHLRPFRYNCLMSTVDYVKTLLKLNEIATAKGVILDTLNSIQSDNDIPLELKSKFLVLLSICTSDPQFAESVLNNPKVANDIRLLSFKFLKNRCIATGDEKSLMKYTIIEHNLEISPDDILDEGGL